MPVQALRKPAARNRHLGAVKSCRAKLDLGTRTARIVALCRGTPIPFANPQLGCPLIQPALAKCILLASSKIRHFRPNTCRSFQTALDPLAPSRRTSTNTACFLPSFGPWLIEIVQVLTILKMAARQRMPDAEQIISAPETHPSRNCFHRSRNTPGVSTSRANAAISRIAAPIDKRDYFEPLSQRQFEYLSMLVVISLGLATWED